MKISVVIATYNGSKYFEEQLNSILNQSRKPDEVIINDDLSTDNTFKVAQTFIERNHLYNAWKLDLNNPAKGCTLNFLTGTEKATGDIIFFCDQDDIWHQDKLKLMEAGFEKYQDMLACYCLENYVDQDGNELHSSFQFTHNANSNKKGFTKVSFIDNIKYNKCPGLCLAFRREVFDQVSAMIKDYKLMHDLPIGNYAALKKGLYVLNEKLVNYRQHTNNLSAPKITVGSRIKNIDYQIRGRKGRYKQLSAFYNTFSDEMSADEKKLFFDCVKQTQLSIGYLENRNVGKLVGQIFHRNPMINRWISLNNLLCVIYARK